MQSKSGSIFRGQIQKLHRNRTKVARKPQLEAKVWQIRRKYLGFGKEKIQKILERDDGINISASLVDKILLNTNPFFPRLNCRPKELEFKKE
jgi:hypothetical protein